MVNTHTTVWLWQPDDAAGSNNDFIHQNTKSIWSRVLHKCTTMLLINRETMVITSTCSESEVREWESVCEIERERERERERESVIVTQIYLHNFSFNLLLSKLLGCIDNAELLSFKYFGHLLDPRDISLSELFGHTPWSLYPWCGYLTSLGHRCHFRVIIKVGVGEPPRGNLSLKQENTQHSEYAQVYSWYNTYNIYNTYNFL